MRPAVRLQGLYDAAFYQDITGWLMTSTPNGFGAVKAAVKQIGRRLQISGACWKLASVNPMLRLRYVYLNGQLAI
jgi:hypothetical protein